MENKKNRYCYKTSNGLISGYFNIYQARNGKIFMQLGNSYTPLTIKQVNDLNIDCYSLNDFNINDYSNAYNL